MEYTIDAHAFRYALPCFQTIYNAMLENNCSEHASRMSAMENSTKSAGEMLNKLTLSYNRWDGDWGRNTGWERWDQGGRKLGGFEFDHAVMQNMCKGKSSEAGPDADVGRVFPWSV